MFRVVILILAICSIGEFVQAQTSIFFTPKTSSSRPTLVFVHGGAWVSRSAADYSELGRALAERGYCAASVEYRLAPEFKHPAPVDDLNAALEKLKASKKPNCDLRRFVLIGHSAGAHMIAYWATLHSDPSVIGFVGIEGIYDLPALVQRWPTYKDQFVVAEFGEASEWRRASPTSREVLSRAPWLIVHSPNDELVDVAQSRQFREHLLNQKVVADLNLESKENHFGVIESLSKKDSRVSKALDSFLIKLKK